MGGKMSKQTIINLVVLVVTVACAIGTMRGLDVSKVDTETIGIIAGALVTIIAPVWLAWKNTPVTSAAKKGQAVINGLKKGIDNLSPEERETIRKTLEEVSRSQKAKK
jgi:SPP1 family holin